MMSALSCGDSLCRFDWASLGRGKPASHNTRYRGEIETLCGHQGRFVRDFQARLELPPSALVGDVRRSQPWAKHLIREFVSTALLQGREG